MSIYFSKKYLIKRTVLFILCLISIICIKLLFKIYVEEEEPDIAILFLMSLLSITSFWSLFGSLYWGIRGPKKIHDLKSIINILNIVSIISLLFSFSTFSSLALYFVLIIFFICIVLYIILVFYTIVFAIKKRLIM